MTNLLDFLQYLNENPAPSRELDGRVMFNLFAKPHPKARSFYWPENQPNWSFALMFAKVPKRSPERETITWFNGQEWVLMNDLRVPDLTSNPFNVLTLLKYFPAVSAINIDFETTTVSAIQGSHRIVANGPTVVIAAIKLLVLMAIEIRSADSCD